MTCAVKEMVAAKPAADGQTTHPLPPLGLYVTLYKTFLSASQAWCVYTALGAYPWHWLFEPRWRFRGSAANRSWKGGTVRGRHKTGPLDISTQPLHSAC